MRGVGVLIARVLFGVTMLSTPAQAGDLASFFGLGEIAQRPFGFGPPAQQGPRVYRGNDTGGIIAWSCEAEADAELLAKDHCARWNKYPRITSLHRVHGDYIAFVCLWNPYVNPYAIPRAHTRTACYDRQYGPAVKALN